MAFFAMVSTGQSGRNPADKMFTVSGVEPPDEAIHHAEFRRAPRTVSPVRTSSSAILGRRERQIVSERRKDADADSLANRAFAWRSRDRELQLAPRDRRSVHNADHGLADFQHPAKARETRQASEKHAASVFADVDSAQKTLHAESRTISLSHRARRMNDSTGDFAEHGFIEKIMFRTVEGHPRDAGVDAELHMLKLFGLRVRLRCEISVLTG